MGNLLEIFGPVREVPLRLSKAGLPDQSATD